MGSKLKLKTEILKLATPETEVRIAEYRTWTSLTSIKKRRMQRIIAAEKPQVQVRKNEITGKYCNTKQVKGIQSQ